MKELRLRDISTQEGGNAYAPEFIEHYNKRFAKEPLSTHDAHRAVRDDENLALIFTWQEDRKVSKNLTLHYKGRLYLIEPNPETQRIRGKRCHVCSPSGEVGYLRYFSELVSDRQSGCPKTKSADLCVLIIGTSRNCRALLASPQGPLGRI